MPTTNPAKACPALSILLGTMGARGRKQLLPEHRPDRGGICGHCGTTVKGVRR